MGANPSTSTAAANLDADRYSEIIPLERSFMGEIHILLQQVLGLDLMQFQLMKVLLMMQV
jgi:hypothetical protein